MKKLLVLLLAVCCCGCSSFLDVESIGKNTIASHFGDMGGLITAGEGMHRKMLEFYDGQFLRYADIAGDMLNNNAASEGDLLLYNYSLAPSDNASYPYFLWAGGYEIITAANNILYYGPKLKEKYPQQSSVADKIMAQAYFARALAHFCLCNCYAQPFNYTSDASHTGIPVIDYVPGFDDEVPRSSVATVYKLVISDLETALEIFSSLGDIYPVTDCYHASGAACEALLARVFLYMEDWDKAESYSKNVMSHIPLSPRSEYVDMFRKSHSTPGTESVFRLNSYSTTSSMRSLYDPTSLCKFIPNPDVKGLFEGSDIRKDLLTYIAEDCEEEIYQGKEYPAVCKYLALKSISDEKARVSDIFVLRVSEMYLIHAEALVKGSSHDLDAAASDLRDLLARAKGVDKNAVSLSYSSQESMENLITLERKRELCYEGHSIFDIIRCKKDLNRPSSSNARVLHISYPNHRFILPICQLEMTSNDNMIQNEGYDEN